MRCVQVVRIHGDQLVSDLKRLVGLPRLEIGCLHLFVNPADRLMLGSLTGELLHQRQLLGIVLRLADLLKQLPFRSLSVHRAELMPLRRSDPSRNGQEKYQGVESHLQPSILLGC